MAGKGDSEEQFRTLVRLIPVARAVGLYLAGGTGLAFHLHHRVSRDIDLFSINAELDLDRTRALLVELPATQVVSLTNVTLRLSVAGMPVDVVKYPYALLRPTLVGPANFPTASLEDLSTMKLAAVSRRGIRRDFWDLHTIFHSGAITLQQALDSYTRRYALKESDSYHVLRSMTYFAEAEADPLLPAGLTDSTWQVIKAWFLEHVPAALEARFR